MKNHDLLTAKECAEFLRISTVTLWRLRKQAKIPFARVGKQCRYRKEDLLKYLTGVTHIDTSTDRG